jgi:hypothetical protein
MFFDRMVSEQVCVMRASSCRAWFLARCMSKTYQVDAVGLPPCPSTKRCRFVFR